eukprot:4516861-Alexandrium_andersonii.AAC.1
MSASLVGSEMCIRDSFRARAVQASNASSNFACPRIGMLDSHRSTIQNSSGGRGVGGKQLRSGLFCQLGKLGPWFPRASSWAN